MNEQQRRVSHLVDRITEMSEKFEALTEAHRSIGVEMDAIAGEMMIALAELAGLGIDLGNPGLPVLTIIPGEDAPD